MVAGLGLLVALLSAAFCFPHQFLCVDSGNMRADAIVVLGGGSYERPVRAAELFKDGAAPRIIVSGAGDADTDRRILESKGVPAAVIQMEPNSRSTRQNAQFSILLLRAMSGDETTPRPTLSPDGAERADGGETTPHPTLSPDEAERADGGETTPHPTLSPNGAERGAGEQETGTTPHPTLSPNGAERERGGRGRAGARRVIIVTSWYHSRRALHTFEHYAPDIQFYSRPSYFAYPRSEWAANGMRKYICAEYVKLAGYWVCYGVCPL